MESELAIFNRTSAGLEFRYFESLAIMEYKVYDSIGDRRAPPSSER